MSQLKIIKYKNNYTFSLRNLKKDRLNRLLTPICFIKFPLPTKGNLIDIVNFECNVFAKCYNFFNFPDWMKVVEKKFCTPQWPNSNYAVVGHCILPTGWMMVGILATAEHQLAAYGWRRAILESDAKALAKVMPCTLQLRKQMHEELKHLLLGEDKVYPPSPSTW